MGISTFNRTIDIWIEELAKFNLHDLLRRPDEKSWSLGQLYQHILEETKWYFSQIEDSLIDKDNVCFETSEAAKILFERGAFEDRKFQGDPLISEKVKQPKSLAQLLRDFGLLKIEANNIWNRMEDTKEVGKSQHPGIGYLNCFEWLNYAEMHMRHHLKQKAGIESFLMQA